MKKNPQRSQETLQGRWFAPPSGGYTVVLKQGQSSTPPSSVPKNPASVTRPRSSWRADSPGKERDGQ